MSLVKWFNNSLLPIAFKTMNYNLQNISNLLYTLYYITDEKNI